MARLKKILGLEQTLEDIREDIARLRETIPALLNAIDTGGFVPEAVNETIREALERLNSNQTGFEAQFVKLQAGALPLGIADACSILKECRKKAESMDKYLAAAAFFMSLRSDDPYVQGLLEKRQCTLGALDFENMDEQEVKDAAECYLRLYEAFYEKDPRRKFALLYSSGMEEEIATGIAFQELHILEEGKAVGEVLSDEIAQAKTEGESAADALDKAKLEDGSAKQPAEIAEEESAEEAVVIAEEKSAGQQEEIAEEKSTGQQEEAAEEKNAEQLVEIAEELTEIVEQVELAGSVEEAGKIIDSDKIAQSAQEYVSVTADISDQAEKVEQGAPITDSLDKMEPAVKDAEEPIEIGEVETTGTEPTAEVREVEATGTEPTEAEAREVEATGTEPTEVGARETEVEEAEKAAKIEVVEEAEKAAEIEAVEEAEKAAEIAEVEAVEATETAETIKTIAAEAVKTEITEQSEAVKTEITEQPEATEIKEAVPSAETEIEWENPATEALDSQVWKEIGIEKPQDMITKERPELLDVQQSARAFDKFRVKDFRKDLNGISGARMVECLTEALGGGGYAKESIALWMGKKSDHYAFATDRLFELGYLKKYAVKGFGEFFTLSAKGEKAFVLNDSLTYIRRHFKNKINFSRGGEHIGDSANAAVTRILYQQSLSRLRKLDEAYAFHKVDRHIGVNYFMIDFPKVFQNKTVCIAGIVSDAADQFQEFYTLLKETCDSVEQYIVTGAGHEAARFTAKWIYNLTGGRIPVWYCGYEDEAFYHAKTDEMIVDRTQEEAGTDGEREQEEAAALTEREIRGREADCENEREPEHVVANEDEQETGRTVTSGNEQEPEQAADCENEQEIERAVTCENEQEPERVAVSGNKQKAEREEHEAACENEQEAKQAAASETEQKQEQAAVSETKQESEQAAVSETKQESEQATACENESGEEQSPVEQKKENTSRKATAIQPQKASALPAVLSEEDKRKYHQDFEEMLVSRKFHAATAYVAALAREFAYFGAVYRQLAYALNDPMERCSYSSDTMITIFYSGENLLPDHYVVAAALRNYFLDQYHYDYSLQQLQAMLSGNQILQQEPALNQIIYTLQRFKTDYHSGIDRYADYREKERASWELRLEKLRREAKSFYDNYSAGGLKEKASHKRFMETEKLLLGTESELSEYLKVVVEDDREMVQLLEEFLVQSYVKDQAEVREENIDAAKIDHILDMHWDLAAQNMRLVKKSSDLMSSLRMNLFKKVNKIVAVLCNYVFLMHMSITREDDPALLEYKKVRTSLLKDICDVMGRLSGYPTQELSDMAGRAVLIKTLEEMKERLTGRYKEGDYKYFYIEFLKDDQVLLDDNFIPVLDEVQELADFSVKNRIIAHCKTQERKWHERLEEIFRGGDDYGSAELILRYLKAQNQIPDEMLPAFNLVEKAVVYAQDSMKLKRTDFIEDLELAQSYGQIDNTKENSKESMLQIMEAWFQWAMETKNYGFFRKILEAFKQKIRKDAHIRAVELTDSLQVYLDKNTGWGTDSRISGTVTQIQDRIAQQNYAAAEDLLNRLITDDLDTAVAMQQTDELLQFLDEYDVNYKRTANSSTNLKSLVYTSRINKDTKGADRLLENWPKGTGTGVHKICALLRALGFEPDTVEAEPNIQGKIENYLVTLKRPRNGRKSNYKHPISAFGSEAETKGFRVVCIFGKSDAQRLIDTFREIGNAKNTIVLLDYALTLADRRTLARKTKTDLSGSKTFAVIDRVVLIYLAKHYNETAVNRMLMAVIMPFASYQPYIDKSADVMPQEIFIGRKTELEKIESPTGVNIVYGGRQLGKTALLRMAKKDIDRNENGDRAVIVNAWKKDYREVAKAVSAALYDEKILKKENITEDWNELARDVKNRLRDEADPIPYFLLMIDEADVFIESCEAIDYQPLDTLKDIQSIGSGRFKFVIAGLRNIVRFKRMAALSNNSVLTHLESLTVKPFKSMEARELLEVPLFYLGFRFPKNNETEVLISTIFGTTNYFPGLIQMYCTKLIEAMKRDYAVYSESETPPYYVQKEHIKKVLAEQSLQQDIREKFFITLKVGDDDYYYMIALLTAYHYHENRSQNGCNAQDLIKLAETFSIRKLTQLGDEKITALMEEMCELNVLQHTGNGRYRFARHSFCQMMGTVLQIDDELLQYMED